MRSFVTDGKMLLRSPFSLLHLIRDAAFAIRRARNVINASRIESKELLNNWSQLFVPKFLVLAEEISLGALYKLY